MVHMNMTETVIEGNPGLKVLSLDEYLLLLEEVENNHPDIARNTRLMITKFRKAFYNSFGWNDELIRGTADVKPFEHLPDGLTPQNHLIKLSNGDYFDIAHIFAILDSWNHPGYFTPLPDFLMFLHRLFPTVKSRFMASGWLGDLSSVTGQFFLHWKETGTAYDDKGKQDIIEQYAPGAKMLANADSVIIPHIYNLGIDNGLKVSEIIKDYYSEDGLGLSFRKRRFSLFAELLGLGDFEGQTFQKESSWLKFYFGQLKTCSAFYLIFFRKKISTVWWSLLIWLGFYKKELEDQFVLTLFLDALKVAVKKEQEN